LVSLKQDCMGAHGVGSASLLERGHEGEVVALDTDRQQAVGGLVELLPGPPPAVRPPVDVQQALEEPRDVPRVWARWYAV
jgi:hypothetical protein